MLEPCCTLQRWGFGFLLVSSRCCVSLMRPSRHSGETLLRVSLRRCRFFPRWGFGFLLVSSRCCVSLMRPSRHSGESLLRVSLRRWRPASVLPTLGIRGFTRFFAVLRLAHATFPALGGVASMRLPTALGPVFGRSDKCLPTVLGHLGLVVLLLHAGCWS
jgi:hypothetical protein